MTTSAKGTFEVKLAPLALHDKTADASLGRMSLDKTFSGGLEAVGAGEMLTALTATKGSAGYVAVERVAGKLHGKVGAFVLQHSGVMQRGEQRLTITVVPDSGTEQLAGLAGKMTIQVVDKIHTYEFEYTLPER